MNPEQQRIAIAEACWWVIHGKDGVALRNPAGEIVNQFYGESWRLPDYLNDLNAMHSAEETLLASHQLDFAYHIKEIACPITGEDWVAIHATAAQRAEAFLRTLNLWTE